MEFKDYHAALGIAADATQVEIKRAYRKQARKYHPDVSKETDTEARFKDITEANEALSDIDRRAAYDAVAERRKFQSSGRDFDPPPGWNNGFEFGGREASNAVDPRHSEFFEALFGRQAAGARGPHSTGQIGGGDHHAKVQVELFGAYRGGTRSVALRVPQIDAQGRVTMQTRQLDVSIPKGIRAGQHLRLAGQGGAGFGGSATAGDLYLEIEFAPTPQFRVDGRDVYLDLPVAPWEAALGATVDLTTPDGSSVRVTVPGGSSTGRTLRLKGQGIPSVPPGDLYAVLSVALPDADTAIGQAAYRAYAEAFADFRPRSPPGAARP